MTMTPIGSLKPMLDLEKISDEIKEFFDNSDNVANSTGIGGDNIPELNPIFNLLDYEVQYTGKHDASIILGRDRAGIANSQGGYGLSANTSCAAIDIVVGRKSADLEFNIKDPTPINPDFLNDAARIYISQKADVDDYFSTPAGKGGISKAKSAIALKADGLRFVARENLKLVVNTDQKNSQGQNIVTRNGVDLIGGNIQDGNRLMIVEPVREKQIEEIKAAGMQPIPLGINLAFALSEMVEKVDKLSRIVSTQTVILNNFMTEMSAHRHENFVNTYFGVPVLPSQESITACTKAGTNLMQTTIAELKLFTVELKNYKQIHLNPGNPCYINSKYHSLN